MMEQLSIFDLTMPYISVDKPIRLIELFSGVGSQAMALRDLGADFEHYRSVEFDEHAVRSYNAIHGTNFPVTDIRDVHGTDLGIVNKDKYSYILTYSFPCVTAGTLVRTNDGYKKIEDIRIGDMVLTHKGRYKKVLKTMSRVSNHINHIIGNGVADLRITDEHPLYVLRNGKEEWVKCKDLKISDKLSFCMNKRCDTAPQSNDVLWLLGRYVADGHINKYTYNSVNFAVSFSKENEFLSHLPSSLAGRFKKFKKTGIWDYRIADAEFQEACFEFGTGSANKEIPGWVFNLPNEKKE